MGNHIPHDIYTVLQTYLQLNDIVTCCKLNTSFYKIASSDHTWKPYFVDNYDNNLFSVNYYQTCKLCYLLTNLTNKLCHENTISNLYNTTSMELNYRHMMASPKISILINLTDLNVSLCSLSTLPLEICGLHNLQSINLYGNRLKTLPAEIKKLSKLQKLVLNNNCLNTLPSELGQLTSLVDFRVTNNNLTMLPSEIGQLINLKWLWADGNPLKNLPIELHRLNLSGLWIDDINFKNSYYKNKSSYAFKLIHGGKIL